MVKNLFTQISEKKIPLAFKKDQAPTLQKWVQISSTISILGILVFSYFVDYQYFHFTFSQILFTRMVSLLASITALGISLFCRNCHKRNWNRVILLLQAGMLFMSIMLMWASELYQEYISTHILLIAFCFTLHRSKGIHLFLLFAVYMCTIMAAVLFNVIQLPVSFSNFIIIILILPYVSTLMYKEKKEEFRSRYLLNDITQKRHSLLQQILPDYVISELETKGESNPRSYKNCSIVFTDFVDFTKVTSKYKPEKVLKELDMLFSAFDNVIGKFRLQKIKTIGDSYMFASGIPEQSQNSSLHAALASLEILDIMKAYQEDKKQKGEETFGVRIGINTGPVIAGIVGERVFSFDIWGDTVNTASRIESASEDGKICISESCYQQIKKHFICVKRGMVPAKGKGKLQMYFLEKVR